MKKTTALLAAGLLSAVIAATSSLPASAQKATPQRPQAATTATNTMMMRMRDTGVFGIDSAFSTGGPRVLRPNALTSAPGTATRFVVPTPAMLRQLSGTGVVTAVRGSMLTFRAQNGMTALLRLRSLTARRFAVRVGTPMTLRVISNRFVQIQIIRTTDSVESPTRP
jgi:hypothetical protein